MSEFLADPPEEFDEESIATEPDIVPPLEVPKPGVGAAISTEKASGEDGNVVKAVLRKDWDPDLDLHNRRPTRACLSRIQQDMKELTTCPIDGLFAFRSQEHATVINVLITGPLGTPYVSSELSISRNRSNIQMNR